MVADGAKIKLLGEQGEDIKVTNITTGNYSFNVLGIIEARYATFEFMDANGIHIENPGLVAPANPSHRFNNCIFRNGASAPSTLLTLNNDQVFIMWDPYFEDTFGNTGSNIRKVNLMGEVTIKSPGGDFAGPEYEEELTDDKANRIIWEDMEVELDLKVLLEGSYNGTNMNTTINNELPLNQPFDTNPLADWYYTGTETLSSIPGNAVDWLYVELRDANSAETATEGDTIAKCAALLLNDGSIVDVDGVSNLQFNVSYDEKLFVDIRSRNHLGVISSTRLIKSAGIFPYDFSSGIGQAYGGPDGHKHLGGGVWGMRSGDANGNGDIEILDINNVWRNQVGFSGYLESDFNLDGQSDNKDKDDYWLPNLGKGSFIPE
jgi:hypothetical protein